EKRPAPKPKFVAEIPKTPPVRAKQKKAGVVPIAAPTVSEPAMERNGAKQAEQAVEIPLLSIRPANSRYVDPDAHIPPPGLAKIDELVCPKCSRHAPPDALHCDACGHCFRPDLVGPKVYEPVQQYWESG